MRKSFWSCLGSHDQKWKKPGFFSCRVWLLSLPKSLASNGFSFFPNHNRQLLVGRGQAV
jgi:hypothetical protein